MSTLLTHLLAIVAVVVTYPAAHLAADAATTRVRRGRHRRQLRRAGRLLQRVRPRFEATGTRW